MSTFPDWIYQRLYTSPSRQILSHGILSLNAFTTKASTEILLEFVFTKLLYVHKYSMNATAAAVFFLSIPQCSYFRLQSSGKWIAANRVRHFLQQNLTYARIESLLQLTQHVPCHTDKRFVWPRSNSRSSNIEHPRMTVESFFYSLAFFSSCSNSYQIACYRKRMNFSLF